MSEPDLSFLDPAGRQPAPTGHAPGTPTPRATPPSTGAEGLVAELRAYQAEQDPEPQEEHSILLVGRVICE